MSNRKLTIKPNMVIYSNNLTANLMIIDEYCKTILLDTSP